MTCPNCLCPAHFEVTITIGSISQEGLRCEFCGNIWPIITDVEKIVPMNCPKCTDTIGANVVLNTKGNLPEISCCACGSLWTVRKSALPTAPSQRAI